MEMIYKSARLEKQTLSESELALINKQSLRELNADEVFAFRLAACDNQVDRDNERFTENTLSSSQSCTSARQCCLITFGAPSRRRRASTTPM